jgi:hypothetical protein
MATANRPIRSTENLSDLGKRVAVITAPYVEDATAEVKLTWNQFKNALLETAVTYGEDSLEERRRRKRAFGRINDDRIPYAVGTFDEREFALVAPANADFDSRSEIEVVTYDIPTAWVR